MKFKVLLITILLIITLSHARAETLQELLNKGNALFEEGDYEKSIPYFDKALETEPACEIAWFRKGVALYKLTKYKEADICFDEVIKMTSGNADVWYLKALTLYKKENYKDAIVYFDKVLEIAPGNNYNAETVGIEYISPLNSKGMALFMIENYEEAIKCFDRSIESNPEFALAWKNKGEALKKTGKYAEAKECFDKEQKLRSVEKTPEGSEVSDEWFLTGFEYYKKGIWSKALEWFERALENEPNHAFSLFEIGMVYYSKGDYGKSLEYIDKAFELVESKKDVSGLKTELVYSAKAMVL
ncbi:MAG TPA: tetratricopeptide repeat protein, partial [Candidatus Eremiobacteraeota bacterium]|nr:tetratricopeptide repeat protein [Candidatus Eremiobacteraeota bacterium]